MKKIIFFLTVIFSVQPNSFSIDKIENDGFEQLAIIAMPKWDQPVKMKKLFGYDPEYNISDYFSKKDSSIALESENPVLQNGTPVVFAHGFGDRRKIEKEPVSLLMYKEFDYIFKNIDVDREYKVATAGKELVKKEGRVKINRFFNFVNNQGQVEEFKENCNAFIISYNFEDALEEKVSLFCTDLGGLKEATVSLYPIVKLVEKGKKEIVLHGHSRGGAVMIRVLYILAHPEQKIKTRRSFCETFRFESTFKKVGLWNIEKNEPDFKKINGVKASIKKVFIVNPFLNINAITNKFIFPGLVKIGLQIISNFTKKDEPAIELLESLIDKEFNIDFSLAINDEVVGNDYDKRLKDLATKAKTWEVRNENCGHNYCDDTNLKNYLASLNKPKPTK